MVGQTMALATPRGQTMATTLSDLNPSHPALGPSNIVLLRQSGVQSLVDLLSLPPERLSNLLQIPFSAVCELRESLLTSWAPSPQPATCLYTEPSTLPTGSPALDSLLGGGLQLGSVCEVFGGPGSGKTQLCLTASALCALGGGRVAFIDTRGGLDTARLLQVLTCQATTGQEVPSSLARVSVALATSPASLLSALQQLPALAPGLVVVDCLTTPVMPLVTDNSLQAAFALGSRAAQLLLKAADGGAAVLVTSNLKAGKEGGSQPALGGVWRGLAHTRLLLEQESQGVSRVERLRGSAGCCSITLGPRGVS